MNRDSKRAVLFFGLAAAFFLTGAVGFGGMLSHDGWTVAEIEFFVIFAALFAYLAFGSVHAIIGVLVRWSGGVPEVPAEPSGTPVGNGRVAILMPVYNEPVERVFRGLRAVMKSVLATADGGHFDLHILSDSNRSGCWLSEQRAWIEWIRAEGLEGRVFYRHREKNIGKKAGNVADFCRARGGDYEFIVVLDADSIMTGEALGELRRRMLANPRLALLQTMPRLVGGKSFYGRLQQFANQLYGPVFMDGLCFWQGNAGNFWGHNAIIRVEPFARECGLPHLPGPEPFGGAILSHDFVEAGMLVAAGWEVRLAPDLEGTYEEGPQSLIDSAARDRRWCQGNLQHVILLAARGLRWRTRVHFMNGIFGYLASPLWLLLMVFGIVAAEKSPPGVGSSMQLLLLTATLLFLPKLLCVVDLCLHPQRRRSFGGVARVVAGSLLETACSALLAPVRMVFHSRFVLWNLLGRKVAWEAQERGAAGTPWKTAFEAHASHVVLGGLLGWLAWAVAGPGAVLVASPVLVGLLLSPLVSVGTSRRCPWAGRLLLTPEEIAPPAEVAEALGETPAEGTWRDELDLVLADPRLNAAHVALTRPGGAGSAGDLEPHLFGEGTAKLNEAERMALLGDGETLGRLHLKLWEAWPDGLSPHWREVMQGLIERSGVEAA